MSGVAGWSCDRVNSTNQLCAVR